MDTAKSIFLAISIILLAIGAWPIAMLTGTVSITLAIIVSIQKEKQFKELEAKVEYLAKKLEAEQAVRRAMDKAESRERKG